MNRAMLGICLSAAVFCGSVTVGASTLGIASPTPVNSPNHASEVAILKDAYRTLEKADHDYKGHRVRAMHHIEEACSLLGLPIKGDGKAHQPQSLSDAELRDAQHKVEEVRHHAAGGQPAIASQLDAAIKEISIALTIK